MNLHRERDTYARLRTAQVRRELRDLVDMVKGAAPVVIGIAGPVAIALPAFAAVPFFYAASAKWPLGLSVLVATLCGALVPFVLLVRRFVPSEQLRWERALPITPRDRYLADSATAGYWLAFLCPIIGLSLLIWRVENPRWIADTWSLVLPLVVSWTLMMFLACHGVLRIREWLVQYAERGRYPSRHANLRRAVSQHAPWQIRVRAPAPCATMALLAKPMVRHEQMQLGIALVVLTVLQATLAWLWFEPSANLIPAGEKGVALSLFAVAAFAYLDDQTGKHVDALRVTLASYPLRMSTLYRSAFGIAAMPTLTAFAVALVSVAAHRPHIAAPSAWSYIGVLGLGVMGTAVLRTRARQHRPLWVVVSAILLSAIGGYVQ